MLNVFLRYLCMSLQYFDTLGWVFWPVKKIVAPIQCYRRRKTMLNQSVLWHCWLGHQTCKASPKWPKLRWVGR